MQWLTMPYINLPHIAFLLYGSTSRLYTRRLQMKVRGLLPFEPWELTKLEVIRHEIASGLIRQKARF
jgi:hypothetical protein